MPPPADSTDDGGKGSPPCGPTTSSGAVTQVMGGHALTISINETVYHPGHYRIALASTRAGLPADPVATAAANGNSISAPIMNPAVLPVLADGVLAHESPQPQPFPPFTVTIPNMDCPNCVLQVIQFMEQHPLNRFTDGGIAGGYYYHHCATLNITRDPNMPADGGATGQGGARADAGADAKTGAGGTTTGGSQGGTTGGGQGGAPSGSQGGATGSGGSPTGSQGGSNGGGGQTGTTGTGGSAAGTAGGTGTGNGTGGNGNSGGGGGCAVSAGSASGVGLTFATLLIVGLVLRRRRR